MTGQPLVAAERASFGYEPGTVVLAEVSATLAGGELVIVLGPNGGGKTTLFRALTGELSPLEGSLAVRAPVAYLPQRDASRIDFPVSAIDVVMMGLLAERKFWQRTRGRDRQRALAALEKVGLSEHADRTYGELSGGQRRRVLLARTIVGGAQILLLDEPLAGVDPRSAEEIRRALDALRDEGRLVIEASHDIDHARGADRVICLSGRVIADGDPDSTLTDAVLRETYAGEISVIRDQEGRAVLAATEPCAHDHEAGE